METPLLPEVGAPEPRTLLGSFNELLVQPLAVVERSRHTRSSVPLRLLAGSFAGYALYGLAAGFFQGGEQILIAAFKAPLILGLTLLLCAPSLYVFGALAGARWTARSFVAVLAGFAGILSLLLAALLPISWLFSVSSRYLGSVVWLHVVLWLLALAVGWRFLGRALATSGARGMFFWLLLFGLVSLQAATFLRPVLWRDPGAALFRMGEKMSFFEHLGKVYDADEKREEERRAAAQKEREEKERAEKEKAEKAKEAEKKGTAAAAVR